VVSQGLIHVAVGLTVAVACGLAFGLAVGLAAGFTVGLTFGLTVGLECGLMLGLLLVSDSPWPRYVVACLLLARRGELPHRPAMFLDWAYDAGLIRLSGIALQFRHREFQDWLTARNQEAEHPVTPTSPATPSTASAPPRR